MIREYKQTLINKPRACSLKGAILTNSKNKKTEKEKP